jgi:hypothetical protein
VIENGKPTQFVITSPGSGYNTPPDVTIDGIENVRLIATLSFDKNLIKNGGVAGVKIAPADH